MYCGPLAAIIECHGGNLNCRVVVKRGLRSFLVGLRRRIGLAKTARRLRLGIAPSSGRGGAAPSRSNRPAAGRRGPGGRPGRREASGRTGSSRPSRQAEPAEPAELGRLRRPAPAQSAARSRLNRPPPHGPTGLLAVESVEPHRARPAKPVHISVAMCTAPRVGGWGARDVCARGVYHVCVRARAS